MQWAAWDMPAINRHSATGSAMPCHAVQRLQQRASCESESGFLLQPQGGGAVYSLDDGLYVAGVGVFVQNGLLGSRRSGPPRRGRRHEAHVNNTTVACHPPLGLLGKKLERRGAKTMCYR